MRLQLALALGVALANAALAAMTGDKQCDKVSERPGEGRGSSSLWS